VCSSDLVIPPGWKVDQKVVANIVFVSIGIVDKITREMPVLRGVFWQRVRKPVFESAE
jgi:ABC-type cobalamin transport system ATPase subunit